MTTGEYLIKNVEEQIKKTGNPYEDLRIFNSPRGVQFDSEHHESDRCSGQTSSTLGINSQGNRQSQAGSPVGSIPNSVESPDNIPKIELYGFPKKNRKVNKRHKPKKIAFLGKRPKRKRK